MKQIVQLKQMQIVVQAQYDLAQQAFQKIVAEENALRRELSRLGTLEKSARDDAHRDLEMRSIGADIIWQSWVVRTKTQLNMAISRVLAKKQPHLAIVKRAYGKVLIVNELLEKEEKKRDKKLQSKALSETITQAGLNHY